MSERKVKETVISAQEVSKYFKLYHDRSTSIKDFFLSFGGKTKYEEFTALDNISFDVKKGDFLGIVGRNGSGKSTLLKLLAGVYIPDKGKIEVNGRLIPFLELGVGFNPELTARENIFLNGTILGLTTKELEQKFDEIVDFAEVREFIDMPLKTYSSGMQVRLAFAVAIQADADIYLLDEILAVGDANFQSKSMEQFRKFKKKGKTVVLVSHDLGAIRQYCNKAIYIKDHKLVASGKPETIIGKYIYLDRDPSAIAQIPEAQAILDEADRVDGDVQIAKVEFFDKENTLNTTFISGDSITAKIYINAKKEIASPTLGIALHDDADVLLYGENTLMAENYEQQNLHEGENIISVTIQNLSIIRGNIRMTVAVSNENCQEHYVWEDKKFPFSVVSNGAQEGIVSLKTTWNRLN